MTLAAAIAAEWRHVDGVQIMTYTAPDGTEYSGIKAKGVRKTFAEVQMVGAGALEKTDQVFVVWEETCDVAIETRGILRTAAGINWQVLSVEHEDNSADPTADGVWRCMCRQQVE
jgi:hypothetical protein